MRSTSPPPPHLPTVLPVYAHLQTMSMSPVMRSTSLPFPSSPHCAPSPTLTCRPCPCLLWWGPPVSPSPHLPTVLPAQHSPADHVHVSCDEVHQFPLPLISPLCSQHYAHLKIKFKHSVLITFILRKISKNRYLPQTNIAFPDTSVANPNYFYVSGSGSESRQFTVPVPTFDKLRFGFRLRIQTIKRTV